MIAELPPAFILLIGAILVLPSLLVLWERWHRRRGDLEETPKTAAVVCPGQADVGTG